VIKIPVAGIIIKRFTERNKFFKGRNKTVPCIQRQASERNGLFIILNRACHDSKFTIETADYTAEPRYILLISS
jgi:hypothetical protein